MNEQLQKQAFDIIEILKSQVGEAGSFVAEQTPLIVQELLLYKRITLTAGFVVPFLILLFIIWTWKKHFVTIKEMRDNDKDGVLFATCVTSIPFALIMIINFFQMVKVYVAPRVYLIEYFSRLIKKIS